MGSISHLHERVFTPWWIGYKTRGEFRDINLCDGIQGGYERESVDGLFDFEKKKKHIF